MTKIKYSLVVGAFLAIAALGGCSDGASSKGLEPIGGSSDFFKITLNPEAAEESGWERPTDCRANISKVLCEVNPTTDWGNVLERPCLGGEQKYQAILEEVYDSLDGVNKKMFCSLRRIFIEKEFKATAYASLVSKKNQDGSTEMLPGAIMGFRKALLDEQPDFLKWISWKEQKNFIRSEDEFSLPLQYPIYESKLDISLLQYVVVHEFGHMLDFANGLNQESYGNKNCFLEGVSTYEEYLEKCRPFYESGTWGNISWKSYAVIQDKSDFWGRGLFCFYDCQTYPVAADIEKAYKGLSSSEFITSYASTNAMDDFAESWAIRWLISEKKNELSLQFDEAFKINTKTVYETPKFKTKREFLKNFAEGEIFYP